MEHRTLNSELTIIIATCGRTERLRRCLDCCRVAAERAGGIARLLVADNGTRREARDTVAAVRREWPWPVEFIETPPLDKCAALNAALRRVPDGWVAFTDDDTLPDARWLEAAREYRDANPSLAVFGGRVDLGAIEPPVPWHLRSGGKPREGGAGGIFVRYRPLRVSGALGPDMQVPLGANLFVRRDVFARYGGYNEALWRGLGKYALGIDDGEFGIRLQRAGEPIGYCDESVVVHPCYHEKYALRRRMRNVFAYGYRNPVMHPADRFPWYVVRLGVGRLGRGVRRLAQGCAAQAVDEGLEAWRFAGQAWGALCGVGRRLAPAREMRFEVDPTAE